MSGPKNGKSIELRLFAQVFVISVILLLSITCKPIGINDLPDTNKLKKEERGEMSFQSVQESFEKLKKRFQNREISRQGFIDEIKKLCLKDDQGRFWTIGVQTGKWYYFDGKDWLHADPPGQNEKMICAFCGFENKIDAEVCARCGGVKGEEPSTCPTCGGPLQKPFMTCPRCQAEPETLDAMKSIKLAETAQDGIFIWRSIRLPSALLFGGWLGAFCGILLGAFAGATGAFSESLKFLPAGLIDQQGKLLGAVFFGLLGGLAGFMICGAASFVSAAVVNFVLSLSGGVKFRFGHNPAVPEETRSEAAASEEKEKEPGLNLKE